MVRGGHGAQAHKKLLSAKTGATLVMLTFNKMSGLLL